MHSQTELTHQYLVVSDALQLCDIFQALEHVHLLKWPGMWSAVDLVFEWDPLYIALFLVTWLGYQSDSCLPHAQSDKKNITGIFQHKKWTAQTVKKQKLRHSLMLLWFADLMNVTEEVTIHRPNVSTLLSSAFIRGDLNAATRGPLYDH